MGELYLIRHGQASFGKEDYDQLSELGKEQSRILGNAFAQRKIQVNAIFVGKMLRHRQTAEYFAETFEVDLQKPPDPKSHEGLNEFDHEEIIHQFKPEFQGDHAQLTQYLTRQKNPRQSFQQIFSQAIKRWTDGQHDHEYQESWPDFQKRVYQAVENIIQQMGASKTVLVFTSGGPITTVCQRVLQIPDQHIFTLNWSMVNTSVTQLLYQKNRISVSYWNNYSHLENQADSKFITYR